MATVYKIELVSYWVDYPPKEIAEAITNAIKDLDHTNEIKVEVKKKLLTQ